MSIYRPCFNCKLAKLPCARREHVAASIKGLGLTSVKFRCDEREAVFAIGQRVEVAWLVPDAEGEWSIEATRERWPATVVAERGTKFQILVDDAPSNYGTPARGYMTSQTLYAKVSAAKLSPLDEPERAVCSECQSVQSGATVPGCEAYGREAGGGYAYTPRDCLKAKLPPCESAPTDGAPAGSFIDEDLPF